MSRPDRLRIPTYRQVWRQERVLYQIERIRLPFPITFRQMGIFVVSAVIMVILSRLPGLRNLPFVVNYIAIPGLLAWYLTRQTLDGKPPHLWLRSMLRYYSGPKHLRRLEKAPRPPRRKRG